MRSLGVYPLTGVLACIPASVCRTDQGARRNRTINRGLRHKSPAVFRFDRTRNWWCGIPVTVNVTISCLQSYLIAMLVRLTGNKRYLALLFLCPSAQSCFDEVSWNESNWQLGWWVW